jgi:membrane protease YdiL (CAAX protease family)
MEDTLPGLRVQVALGLTLLLVLLRLEAERFGAAEYDEPAAGRMPSLMRRLAWYALGIGGVFAILYIHPSPDGGLFLGFGDRARAIGLGVVLGLAGAGQAVAIAWSHYRHLRLPDPRQYPGALVNEIGTAFVDEAVFRGALLGALVAFGMDPNLAIVIQTLIYGLATRTGAPGRDLYRFVMSLMIGLVGGWATVATGGIAASFLGHAVTRVAIFLTTGHSGQWAPRGREAEDVERRRRTPDGWRVVGTRDLGRGR